MAASTNKWDARKNCKLGGPKERPRQQIGRKANASGDAEWHVQSTAPPAGMIRRAGADSLCPQLADRVDATLSDSTTSHERLAQALDEVKSELTPSLTHTTHYRT